MRRHVFGGLDQMRGAAALAVMVYHACLGIGWGGVLPGGYLAVDVFFVISGFVIAYAYDARVGGLGVAGFLRVRLIRLYPLYALGLLLGVAVVVEQALRGANTHGWAVALAANAFFLPAPPTPWGKLVISPIDVPGWSLILEIWINLAFALFHRRLSTAMLALIVGCAGFALALLAFIVGVKFTGGQSWDTAEVGVVRVCFSFPLGVLMYRLRDRLPNLASLAPLVAPALLILFCIPSSGPGDFLFVTVASPLLVAAAAQASRAPLAGFGADTSYAIYVLHFPLMVMVRDLCLASHAPIAMPLFACAAAVVVLAYLADRFYDRPMRAWLSAIWPSARASAATRTPV